jgi:hypothetical protein
MVTLSTFFTALNSVNYEKIKVDKEVRDNEFFAILDWSQDQLKKFEKNYGANPDIELEVEVVLRDISKFQRKRYVRVIIQFIGEGRSYGVTTDLFPDLWEYDANDSKLSLWKTFEFKNE